MNIAKYKVLDTEDIGVVSSSDESEANYKKIIAPMIENRNYKSALNKLAGLRKVVDDFFDNVMVLCDEPKLKKNRLALLTNLNSLFLEIADISKLQD